jgi:hypothetical protein
MNQISRIVPKQMVMDLTTSKRLLEHKTKNQTSLQDVLDSPEGDLQDNLFNSTRRTLEDINFKVENVQLDFDKIDSNTPEAILNLDFGGKIAKQKQKEDIEEMIDDVRKQKRQIFLDHIINSKDKEKTIRNI